MPRTSVILVTTGGEIADATGAKDTSNDTDNDANNNKGKTNALSAPNLAKPTITPEVFENNCLINITTG